MAGLALKVYLFSLILSFCFLYYAGSLNIGSTGATSKTYNQTLHETSNTLQNQASTLFASNALGAGITIVGIILDNTLVALGGFALTLFGTITFQNAVFNESFGNDLGTFITGILVFLYVVGLVSWWAGRSEP